MIVLACGGRDYADQKTVDTVLDALNMGGSVELLIEGGAAGADRLAREWARKKGIHVATVNAMWEKHGPSAGPKRNAAMLLLNPTQLVAFPGGTGTASMIRLATAKGVAILDVSKLATRESKP